jgi:K+-sensing histidine kinase KdpD
MDRVDPSARALIGSSIGALTAVFVAAALVGIRGDIFDINVGVILVICIPLAAFFGGRAAGAVSAFVVALSFDFFHTKPYGSLKVSGAGDIRTIFVVIAVGLAAGEIAGAVSRARLDRRADTRLPAR